MLGAGFIAVSLSLLRSSSPAILVFRLSNVYLGLLFGTVALDVLVGDPAKSSPTIAWIGGIVVIGGSFAVTGVTRPKTLRELGFALVPAAGAVTIALFVLSRI